MCLKNFLFAKIFSDVTGVLAGDIRSNGICFNPTAQRGKINEVAFGAVYLLECSKPKKRERRRPEPGII